MFKYFIFLISFSLSAQIKGIVKDSISGEPIPFVNIWVESENIGTNSESNGLFEIKFKNQQEFVFSILGYKRKKVKLIEGEINNIVLVPEKIELDEVILFYNKNEQITLFDFKGINLDYGLGNAGQEEVHIWCKYISYNSKIKDYPYLKQLDFVSKSELKNSKIRIRFIKMDENYTTKGEIENIIVDVKKGLQINKVNLERLNIKIPETGILIGFEFLKIKENKYDFKYTKAGLYGKFKGYNYQPSIKGFLTDNSSNMVKIYLDELNNHQITNFSDFEIALRLILTK